MKLNQKAMKKYKLTDETILCCGRTLHRIVALRDFDGVRKGDKGGGGLKKKKICRKRAIVGYMMMYLFMKCTNT